MTKVFANCELENPLPQAEFDRTTCYGQIKISYEDLCNFFGPPDDGSIPAIACEWNVVLQDQSGQYAIVIYHWLDSEEEGSVNLTEVKSWSVAANSRDSYLAFENWLNPGTKLVKLTVWMEVPNNLEPNAIASEIYSNLSDAFDCKELTVTHVESYPTGKTPKGV